MKGEEEKDRYVRREKIEQMQYGRDNKVIRSCTGQGQNNKDNKLEDVTRSKGSGRKSIGTKRLNAANY